MVVPSERRRSILMLFSQMLSEVCEMLTMSEMKVGQCCGHSC